MRVFTTCLSDPEVLLTIAWASTGLAENIAPTQSVCIRNKAPLTEFNIRVALPDGHVEDIKADPCRNASSLLLQLLHLRRSHPFPTNLALFLPDGRALDFDQPLQVQGVHGGIELRVAEAPLKTPEAAQEAATGEIPEGSHRNFDEEVEMGWNLIYWPLCVAQTAFAEVLAALKRHKEVVVLAWEACHDLQVMQLGRELSHNVSSDYFIATGTQDPPEDWWLNDEEEAALAAAAALKQFSLRGSGATGSLPKSLVLKLPRFAPPDELGPAWGLIVFRFFPKKGPKPWLHSTASPWLSFQGEENRAARCAWSSPGVRPNARVAQEPFRDTARDLDFVQEEQEGLDGATVSVLFFVVAGALVLCCLQGEVNSGLGAAGCGTSLALLVVSRAFQSRRPVSVLNWSLRQEEFAHLRVSVLPYSWDPRFVYREDCRERPDEVLLEAQLLTEMNPSVWVEEEGQEAEIGLSRLLSAHPQPDRPHWHKGFYSKPFKDTAF
eukprot:s1122_g2.t2